MPNSATRHKWFVLNSKIVKAFCEHHDLKYQVLNSGYQIRIEELVDIYPVRRRWHNIRTGERGEWEGEEDLRKIMLLAIPPVQVVEVDNGELTYPETDGVISPFGDPKEVDVAEQTLTLGGDPRMWYKKPKWWQWRLKRKYRRILKTK